MNPDPFNTHARTGHPVSTRNKRRSKLPQIMAAIMAALAIGLAIMAIYENAK